MTIRYTFPILLAAGLLAACNNNNSSELPPAEVYTLPETEQPAETVTAHTDTVAPSGDTITTSSGLQYIILKEGNGPLPKPGRSVSVNYTGYLMDGTKFDSSVPSGRPFTFRLGTFF